MAQIKQQKLNFNPITITLDSVEEAEAFVNVIDNIDLEEYEIDSPERNIIITLSNSFCSDVNIP